MNRATETRSRRAFLVKAFLGVSVSLWPMTVAGAGPGGAATPKDEQVVRLAIVAAVQARVGVEAQVRIEALDLDLAGPVSRVVARLEPGAVVGKGARFTLAEPSAPKGAAPAVVGRAVATLAVAVPHARATRDLARGETIAAADADASRDEVGAVAIQRLPRLEEVFGARVLRPVRAGEPIVTTAIALPPLVRSGATVEAHARVGRVDAVAMMTASQTGSLGDVIQVVNPRGGRRLRARVSGPDAVEVMR